MNAALFSSKSHEWETPQELFDGLNRRYNFTLDPCATAENAKCPMFFDREVDGLSQSWAGHRVFCNPPYGREIAAWVEKCYVESMFAIVVGLLPARTDTKWFHNFIHGRAQVEFIRGRLKFGGAKNSAPFPSMIVRW